MTERVCGSDAYFEWAEELQMFAGVIWCFGAFNRYVYLATFVLSLEVLISFAQLMHSCVHIFHFVDWFLDDGHVRNRCFELAFGLQVFSPSGLFRMTSLSNTICCNGWHLYDVLSIEAAIRWVPDGFVWFWSPELFCDDSVLGQLHLHLSLYFSNLPHVKQRTPGLRRITRNSEFISYCLKGFWRFASFHLMSHVIM